MRTSGVSFVEEHARRYIRELVSGESPVMRRVREACEREDLPNVSPETGRVLQTLAAAAGARRVLEIGCCVGYSALWLAQGLAEGGKVETIEFDPELAARARENFREAGVAERVEVLEGDALDVLPRLTGPYDLVFIDADKRQYLAYLRFALGLARPRGIIAADNLLWGGRVMDPRAEDDDTNGIRQFTKALLANANLVSAILPVGDGLSVSVLQP